MTFPIAFYPFHRRVTPITCAWLMSFVCFYAPAQTTTTDSLAGKSFIDKVVKASKDSTRATEKVYLHFDKPYYVVGDNCWFKAYVVDGEHLLPTDRSGVLYVDWISPAGKLLLHQQLKLTDGTAHGDFAFYTSATEGVYTVRAYTQWMRNEDTDFFYSAALSVYNPFKATVPPTSIPKAGEPDIQFFPEGGALINGIASKVAFKAIGPDGIGMDIEGDIVDEKGEAVTHFKSSHKGMGVFLFAPMKGRTYLARWATGKTIPLPVSEDSGAALFVNNLSLKTLGVQIQVSSDRLGSIYYLVGQCRGYTYTHQVRMITSSLEIAIPKAGLESGVMQLTLFDSLGIPRCERMVFIDKKERLTIDVQSDKVSYGPREPVTLTVKVTDPRGLPVTTEVSLAVTDAGFAARDENQENILTRLLLQSDLRGRIEDPGWYFNSSAPARAYSLDLVMMTHGWRKFNWDIILSDSIPSIKFVPEKGLTLQGQVINKENNRPLSRGKIALIAKGGGHDAVHLGETDEHGLFRMTDVDLNDSTILVWKTQAQNGRLIDGEVKLSENEYPPITLPGGKGEIPPEKNESVDRIASQFRGTNDWNFENVQILQEVEIKEKRIVNTPIKALGPVAILLTPSKSDLATSSYQFVTRFAPRILMAQPYTTPKGNDAWAVKTGRGAVIVTVKIDGLTVVGDPDSWDPSIGTNMDPFSAINSVPIDEIDHIVTGGASVNIFTIGKTKHSARPKEPGLGITRFSAHGYDWPREFYQQKYYPNDTTQSLPDHRITLLWAPEVQTNAEGEAEVHFFNTDSGKEWQVVVEGVAQGMPGTVTKKFEIDPAKPHSGRSLSGRILDSSSGEPVPFASVFMAKTMIGTIAKEDGSYQLDRIPPGKYDLTISSVGYKLASIPFELSGGSAHLDVRMEPDNNVLGEVVIKAKKENRSKFLGIFRQQFLGETSNAALCTIKNLDDVDFEYDKKKKFLVASCNEPIEVENRALGYKISYLLTQFEATLRNGYSQVSITGIPKFELLTPTDDQEATRWQAARDRAYFGSMTHFMRSLILRQLKENHFSAGVSEQPASSGLERESGFKKVDESYLLSKRPDSLNTVKIVYNGEIPDWKYPLRNPEQISFIQFKDRGLVIHNNGYYDNFTSFIISGYLGWAWGIAELVPLEYEPVGGR